MGMCMCTQHLFAYTCRIGNREEEVRGGGITITARALTVTLCHEDCFCGPVIPLSLEKTPAPPPPPDSPPDLPRRLNTVF